MPIQHANEPLTVWQSGGAGKAHLVHPHVGHDADAAPAAGRELPGHAAARPGRAQRAGAGAAGAAHPAGHGRIDDVAAPGERASGRGKRGMGGVSMMAMAAVRPTDQPPPRVQALGGEGF